MNSRRFCLLSRFVPGAVLAALAFLTISPANAGRGGPDAGGWMWIDSNEPGIDASVETFISQTQLTTAWLDEEIIPVAMSFPVTLYGTTSSTVYLSSNGWLSLLDPGAATAANNLPMPAVAAPNATLAWFWDDLDGSGSNFALHGPTPNGHLIILRMAQKGTGALLQASIQFFLNGQIKVLYSVLPSNLASATIGIENGAGTIGTQLLFNGTSAGLFNLAANYAVVYFPESRPSCATAPPLACSGSVVGTTVGGGMSAAAYGCNGINYNGADRAYELTLSSTQQVDLALTGIAGNQDIFIIAQSCDGFFGCIGGGTDNISLPVLGSGTYYVIVDGETALDDGPFTLTATCSPPAATTLSCGQVDVQASNAAPSVFNAYTCGGAASYPQGEAYYEHTVASRSIVTYTLSDPANYDAFIFPPGQLGASCAYVPASATLANVVPGDHVIALDSVSASGFTGFGATCTPMNEQPLSCGQFVTATTGNIDSLDNWQCALRFMNGGEAYFVFDNPVMQTISFGLSGIPQGEDLDVFILDGSAPFSATSPDCLATGRAVATLQNAPAGEYLIVVDGTRLGFNVPFELTAACGASTTSCGSAPTVTCDDRVLGDTSTGTNNSNIYGALSSVYPGPEQIYHLSNPIQQTVNIALRNADPLIDLILLDACDPTRVIRTGDDSLIELALPAGDYYLVVDSRSATGGPFELVVFCGGTVRLEPATVTATVPAGSCSNQLTQLYLPPAPPLADVMFSLDLSGSMGQELSEVQANIARIYNELSQVIPSLAFGVASFAGAGPTSWTDTVCGVGPMGGGPDFVLDLPVTTDILQVDATVQAMGLLGGGHERYTYSFWQSYGNPNIGWRDCSRRVWMSFGDEEPQDCNIYECLGEVGPNTGMEPGADLTTGVNDLPLVDTVDNMAANGIVLIPIDSSEDWSLNETWDCLAERTGGTTILTDGNGQLPTGSDMVEVVTHQILEAIRGCPEVQLVPIGTYASWVNVTPATVTGVELPFFGEFDVQFCVPPGTSPGRYVIEVEARCVGAGVCGIEGLGIQTITIDVPCAPTPVAMALPPAEICSGGMVTLDGTPSTGCTAAGVEYRWSDGTNTLCDWSGVPTCDVTPLSSPSTYTLDVRCVDALTCLSATTVTVDVTPPPAANAGPDVDVCELISVTLDGATTTSSCSGSVTYTWMEGTTILQSGTDPTWQPPNSPPGTRTYTLVAECDNLPGCSTSDDVTVTFQNCTLAVQFDTLSAVRASGGVDVAWKTLLEEGTLGFVVERADSLRGPWRSTGLDAEAHGAGRTYLVHDDQVADGTRPFYRVIEYTMAGPGDVSAAFQVAEPDADKRLGGARSRTTSRRTR